MARANTQLKLVTMAPVQSFCTEDPTRRVFDHWLMMFGKSAARCKMGPTRRTVINAALALYDEDQVLMAIEGGAADRWLAEHGLCDLEIILKDERAIERYSEAGEKLRRRLEAMERQDAAGPEVDEPTVTPEQAAAARARLAAVAAQLSGRR